MSLRTVHYPPVSPACLASFLRAAAKLELRVAFMALLVLLLEMEVMLLLGDGWLRGVTVAVVRVMELTMVRGGGLDDPGGKPSHTNQTQQWAPSMKGDKCQCTRVLESWPLQKYFCTPEIFVLSFNNLWPLHNYFCVNTYWSFWKGICWFQSPVGDNDFSNVISLQVN